ncbi:hypothetical protein XFF6994_2040013 [Xanthomonas citri pv. fuscans]|nr:hypothetical protein XFF6994_2040013 [Xanthomonas citri pv. fuscans]
MIELAKSLTNKQLGIRILPAANNDLSFPRQVKALMNGEKFSHAAQLLLDRLNAVLHLASVIRGRGGIGSSH